MKSALIALACLVAVAYGQSARASAFSGFPGFKNQYKPQYRPQYKSQYQPLPKYVRPDLYQPVVSTAAPVPAPVNYVARVAGDANAQTLREGNEQGPDGSYNYFFETDNGIAAQAQGTPRNFGGNPPLVPVVSQGAYSWTSPEGEVISINYIADENGFQPTGNAIPTPPPVPPQIARALEYIARNAPRQ